MKFPVKMTLAVGAAVAIVATAALAIDQRVLALLNDGDAKLAAGNKDDAKIDYDNAANQAAQIKDWDGLLNVADRYLKVSDSDLASRTFLLARDDAEYSARHAGDFDDPDKACEDGINALQRVAMFWSVDLSGMAMTDKARTEMSGVADQATKSASDYQRTNCGQP